jgi:hypothetical protein
MPTMKKLWFRGPSKSAISFASLIIEDSEEEDDNWNEGGMTPPMMRWPPMEIKRQGETICEGHRNYELNLQLWIRYGIILFISLNYYTVDINYYFCYVIFIFFFFNFFLFDKF